MPPENRKYRQRTQRGPDMSTWTQAERDAAALRQKLETPIAEMKLSVRVINTLEEHDIILAKDLIKQDYETLIQMKNFGEKTLREVKAAIVALGLPVPDWKKPPKPKLKKPSKSKKNSGFLDFWG